MICLLINLHGPIPSAFDLGLYPTATLASGMFSFIADEYGSNTTPASSMSGESPLDTTEIAVIGYGCRVPGGNNSLSQLWEFLLKKGDAPGEIPEMR